MVLDHTACHAAVRARDPRFDGMFYTAVKTTGIYCRPVCPAKTPNRSNCAFFETAAAAEAAGYRPCLRCRPELSPGSHAPNGNADLAQQFMQQVQVDGLFGESIESAAQRLGVSSRHLRRVVEEQCGVSPIELVRTTRLLFARRLLSTTDLAISSIAFGSGFGSLARFNHAFRSQYALTPTEFRGRTSRLRSRGSAVGLTLACREPFAWETMLEYLRKRAVPGVESVEDGRYWRTMRVGGQTGWLSVGRANGGIDVGVSDELATQLLAVAGRVRRMFDLDTSPESIGNVLRADRRLRPYVERNPGLRVPGSCDGFELTVRAILGQQVTVAAASTLSGRLVLRFAEPAPGAPAGLTHWPVQPAALAGAAVEDIAAAGIPFARAATIREFARCVVSGEIDLQGPRSIKRFGEIRGIGEWTQQYVGMRVFRWPDSFPAGDLGLRRALGLEKKQLERIAENWRPWRAYAAMYLWTGSVEDAQK
jgi:AraC family transcriptional regulator of adaptative response / DNA-3-methyladenine glycosylase II